MPAMAHFKAMLNLHLGKLYTTCDVHDLGQCRFTELVLIPTSIFAPVFYRHRIEAISVSGRPVWPEGEIKSSPIFSKSCP